MSNSISFIGKLGKDSERKQGGGHTFLKFSVANNVGFGDRKSTIWWNCTVFGKQAEGNLMDYLTKGAQVYIVGEVTFREYEGKTYNEVAVRTIELIGSRDKQQAQPQQGGYGSQTQGGYGKQPQKNNQGGAGQLDDDLPFMRLDGRLA